MRLKRPEYKEVKAESIREACKIAEDGWPDMDVVDICIECGKPRSPNKVFCSEHFNEWYRNMMNGKKL